MLNRLDQISVRQVLLASIGLVAILFAIGLATRENVADKPYLTIAGSGFIFNYRVADAYYGFTAIVEKPVRNYSRIEASFEDPAGGPPFLVSTKLTPRSKRYGLRSPPLSGIEKDKPYHVTVRLVQNGDGAVLFEDAFTVASQMSDAVMPPAPLTIGPGYTRNPDLPDGWKAPTAGRD